MTRMRCKDLMVWDVKFCLPHDTAHTAARIMELNQIGVLPVVEDAASMRLTGILTDRDLAMKVVATGRDPKSVRVADVMSEFPVSCLAEDDVFKASQAMDDFNIRRLPIVDPARTLLGIISRSDLVPPAVVNG